MHCRLVSQPCGPSSRGLQVVLYVESLAEEPLLHLKKISFTLSTDGAIKKKKQESLFNENMLTSDGHCCETQNLGKSQMKVRERKKESIEFMQIFFEDVATFCRSPVLQHSKMVSSRSCQMCHAKIDKNCEECPICGYTIKNDGSSMPHLRQSGTCSRCRAICSGRCCPICGDLVQIDWVSKTNPEREPLTWKSTAVRVRTPTGLLPFPPFPLFAVTLNRVLPHCRRVEGNPRPHAEYAR